MNHYMENKFRGCEQIGYKDNPNTGQHLRVYRIPNVEGLVGINDGAACWMANPAYCLLNMKQGISPVHGALAASPRVRLQINTVGSTTGRFRASIKQESNTPKRRRIQIEN